jgi:hypothetical protein
MRRELEGVAPASILLKSRFTPAGSPTATTSRWSKPHQLQRRAMDVCRELLEFRDDFCSHTLSFSGTHRQPTDTKLGSGGRCRDLQTMGDRRRLRHVGDRSFTPCSRHGGQVSTAAEN